MMKSFKWVTAILLMMTLTTTIAQQERLSISGTIKNISNEPVAGATIALCHSGDTSFLAVKAADDKGNFRFETGDSGVYFLKITSAGTLSYNSAAFTLNTMHQQVVLPAIILTPDKKSDLKAVIVTAKRPLIETDIDKTIVNVDAMIASAGANTLEILERTPGVTVNAKGDVGLNGKEGVLILIDGRPTYLAAGDLAAYLRSLPSAMVDKLELMDNPPAKYDAAGSSIINIKLKKKKSGGFTGSISAGYNQGRYARHNESVNINYNRKKLNLFSNISFSSNNDYYKDDYERMLYNEAHALESPVFLNNFQKSSEAAFNARIGADYQVSPNTVIGFIVFGNTGDNTGHFNYRSLTLDHNRLPDSSGTGNTLSFGKRNSAGINLNSLHRFNDKGRELSTDLDIIRYNFPGTQHLNETNYQPDETLSSSRDFFYNLSSAISIFTAKADYVHPLPHSLRLEAGLKASLVNNDDDSKYFDKAGGHYLPDYSRSNHFLYHENVNAGYINLHRNFRRFGLQAGIRAENTNLEGELIANAMVSAPSFSRHYTDIFPSFFASIKLDSAGNNTLALSISRRIRRPGYQQLNPFLFFKDNYSYSTGNPLLHPQYQYTMGLKFQHRRFLNLGLQYGKFKGIVFETTEYSDSIFITRPENITSGFMLIQSTNVMLRPASWWTVNANIIFAYMGLNGETYGQPLNSSATTLRLNIMNQFNFKKGFSAELSGFCNGRDISGQKINKSRYRVFAAGQKKLLHDKASVRVVLEDIFHSWKQRDYLVGIAQASSVHTGETDSQRIGIAFTYQFGNNRFSRKRSHNNNAAAEETERIE